MIEQTDIQWLATALARLGRVFVILSLLVACGVEQSLDRLDNADLETCCFAADVEACVLGELAPGDSMQLVSCGVTVTFPEITRWDLAAELAMASCTEADPWYCAPERTRELCERKLDPWCAAPVDDGIGLRDCRAAVVVGQPVPAVCMELF